VREECLEFALTENHQHGIWGGLSINRRRQIRKERYRASLASTSEPAAHGFGVVPSVARSSRPAPPASQAARATHS
jgi:Transcription factor WhiB